VHVVRRNRKDVEGLRRYQWAWSYNALSSLLTPYERADASPAD
jgi:hypothetical protein